MSRSRASNVLVLWIENGVEIPEVLYGHGGTMHISRRYPNAFRENDTVTCSLCQRPGVEHIWQLYRGHTTKVVRCSIKEPGTDLRADTVRPTRMLPFIGREPVLMYMDIERPADEPTGTHVVVADIFDPAAHAAAIIADLDQTNPCFHGDLRTLAGEICQRTPYKDWYVGTYHGEEHAAAAAADLNRCHRDAGRRWEVHQITATDWCRFCRNRIVFAAAEWRHLTGRWSAGCTRDIEGAPLDTIATPVPRP